MRWNLKSNHNTKTILKVGDIPVLFLKVNSIKVESRKRKLKSEWSLQYEEPIFFGVKKV